MKFDITSTEKITHSSDIIILAIDDKNNLINGNGISKVDESLVKKSLKKDVLGQSEGDTVILNDSTGLRQYLLLRITDLQNMNIKRLGKVFNKAFAHLSKLSFKTVQMCLCKLAGTKVGAEEAVKLYVRASLHNFYKINAVKSKKVSQAIVKNTIHLNSKYLKEAKLGLKLGQAIADGANLTKDLGNLPPNYCTPTYLGSVAKKIAKDSQMKVKVLGKTEISKLKMGSFLSVAKGSREEPKFIVLEHMKGSKNQKPIVLVGKGITFDAGGISLKPGLNMDEMKWDMGGAATVLGVMHTVGQLKLPLNIVALVPSCENLPDGLAVKPGDVVTSMSGQTIEILNTDAEGRLILCDALTYAERYKPDSVIDVATLTGACVIALGHEASAVYSNIDSLADELISAGEKANDRAWHMPLWDEYQPLLDSNFADMANIGGRAAGSITAACFLSRFATKYNWAHLDIAGTAWISGGKAKGSTGRPVNLLSEFLLNRLKTK
jgi:leucyl aminopeptidase